VPGNWRRPLAVGAPLLVSSLSLTVHGAIPIALEETYGRAAADVYLT
jgi:hypothetical protein